MSSAQSETDNQDDKINIAVSPRTVVSLVEGYADFQNEVIRRRNFGRSDFEILEPLEIWISRNGPVRYARDEDVAAWCEGYRLARDDFMRQILRSVVNE